MVSFYSKETKENVLENPNIEENFGTHGEK